MLKHGMSVYMQYYFPLLLFFFLFFTDGGNADELLGSLDYAYLFAYAAGMFIR